MRRCLTQFCFSELIVLVVEAPHALAGDACVIHWCLILVMIRSRRRERLIFGIFMLWLPVGESFPLGLEEGDEGGHRGGFPLEERCLLACSDSLI